VTGRAVPTADLSPGAREHVLAFADDEHLVGARHTGWIGLGPFLEEDLAFCSIAQDELGHALGLYGLLTDDVDPLALLRPPGGYRSCWLAEWPCERWDDALVRHWLYDTAEDLRWRALLGSSCRPLAALAERARREEALHLRHAAQLLDRAFDSTADARARLTASLARLLPLAPGVWEPVAGESQALADGVTAAPSAELAAAHRQLVGQALSRWDVALAWPDTGPPQQARTARSPDFEAWHATLTEVLDLDRAATW
jgi:ring-1,2-phenylacetyl-CoA epoxidase subunit PaaC